MNNDQNNPEYCYCAMKCHENYHNRCHPHRPLPFQFSQLLNRNVQYNIDDGRFLSVVSI